MIRVTVEKQGERYCSVTSRGHAGYDDSGLDIVCAAVSVLMINAANSLEQLTEDDLTVEEGGEEEGYLRIGLNGPLSESAKLLLDSLMLGLMSVRENYGDPFFTLEVKDIDMN